MTRLPALRNSLLPKMSDFGLFNSRFDEMFDRLFSHDYGTMFDMGIYETEKGYVMEVEMPGFTKDDIKVEISDGTMYVTGERKMSHKNGVGVSKIDKRVSVGDLEVDSANIEHGILKVVFKKPVEDEKDIKQVEVS